MINEPMLAQIALTLWLLPCAIYDQRSHRVPNWLTLPALPLALWWAATNGTLALALTVLVATYLAFQLGGMGGADGKIATVQAAISPAALLVTALLLLATFVTLRFQGDSQQRLPAGLWFFAGALLSLSLTLIPFFLPGDMP